MDIMFIVNLAIAMQAAVHGKYRPFEYSPNGYFELRPSVLGMLELDNGQVIYGMDLWYGVNVATKPLRPGEYSGYQELRCGLVATVIV